MVCGLGSGCARALGGLDCALHISLGIQIELTSFHIFFFFFLAFFVFVFAAYVSICSVHGSHAISCNSKIVCTYARYCLGSTRAHGWHGCVHGSIRDFVAKALCRSQAIAAHSPPFSWVAVRRLHAHRST